MQRKLVVYNGETESYLGCSDSELLAIGNTYEVIDENDRGFQTDYTLKGVSGHFNSVWFTEVKPTYLALCKTIPTKGKTLKSFIRLENGQWKIISHSSTIINVKVIGINVYQVQTRNTIYIVQLLQ